MHKIPLMTGLVAAGALSALVAIAQAETATPVAGGKTYRHNIKASRFDPGSQMREEKAGPYDRIIGDKGVFMVDLITGATLVVPNPPAEIAKGARLDAVFPRAFADNAEKHNGEVLDYLLNAGVPRDEVSGTHVTTTMAGDGPTDKGIDVSNSRLLWYTTHLERTLGGVPVEGSYAFAAFDADGKVITEGVYWPPIGESVVARANALRQRVADDKQREEYLQTIKRMAPMLENERGSVGILHTAGNYHGEFQASAVYTVILRDPNGGKARILRFDDTGEPMRMPDEIPTGIDMPKAK